MKAARNSGQRSGSARDSSARPAPERAAHGPAGHALELAVAALLALLLATQYGNAIHGPFVGDDYVFIQKMRGAGFGLVWSVVRPERLPFHYYRPWSRELHYWALLKLFGTRVVPFHLASLGLGLAAGIL